MNRFNLKTAFIVLLCVAQIFGDHATSTDSSAIKSDGLTRSLPAVPLNMTANGDNFTDLLRLEDVLMVFNLKRLANKWANVHHELRPTCAAQMTEYFRGLQQHKLWAIKSKYCWGYSG